MEHHSIFRLTFIAIVMCCWSIPAQAGQVITDQEKLWARQAAKQEKDLVASPSSNTIAVLNFNNISRNPKLTPLEKGLAVMLITDLAKVDEIQVVERIKIQALLDEIELGESGLVDEETAPGVGRLLGAQYLSSGDLKLGKEEVNLEIDPFLMDVPPERILDQPKTTGALEELFVLEKTILFNIIEQMKIELTPEKEAELRKPLSMSTAALLALFLGIDHSDKGQYTQAAEMYQQALIEDPQLQMAENSLKELKNMNLIETTEVMEKAPTSEPESVVKLSNPAKIGLGAAGVVGAGAATYFILDGVDDDSDSDDEVDPSQPPTLVAVNPSEGATLSCYSGSISFSFSEPMAQTGEANIEVNDGILSGFFTRQFWSNSQTFIVSWSNSGSNEYCYNDTYETEGTVIVQLLNFQDVDGYALMGIKRFPYNGEYFRRGSIPDPVYLSR